MAHGSFAVQKTHHLPCAAHLSHPNPTAIKSSHLMHFHVVVLGLRFIPLPPAGIHFLGQLPLAFTVTRAWIDGDLVLAFREQPPPHVALILVRALTHLPPAQMLEAWPQRAGNVMVLPCKLVLSSIIQRIKLIAPMAIEEEPLRRRIRCTHIRHQAIVPDLVGIFHTIHRRIPQRALIRLVMQEAQRQDIRMQTGRGVIRMRAHGGVHHRALADLLDGVVGVCLAEEMLAEEDDLGFPVLEADETVFPIADVVAEADVQDLVAEVVAVEVEPEGVDDAVAFVDRDQHRRGGGTAAGWGLLAVRGRGFAVGMGGSGLLFFGLVGDVLLAAEPVWAFLDVVVALEVDEAAVVVFVEDV